MVGRKTQLIYFQIAVPNSIVEDKFQNGCDPYTKSGMLKAERARFDWRRGIGMAKSTSELISETWPDFTEAERKVAHIILSNYPLAGLDTISDLAKKAHVSAATITRFVSQLGFSSFAAFREALRQEIEARFLSPIDKRRALSDKRSSAKDSSFGSFFAEVASNLTVSAGKIQASDFAEAVALLADRSRAVFLVGGRISAPVAGHTAAILHSLRAGTYFLEAGGAAAVERLVDIRQRDVLFVLDIRRYQRDTIELARQASLKGCKIILVTDEWISPISKYASIIFALKVGTNSIWDSAATPLVFCEALANEVGLATWPIAQRRLREVEGYWRSWMTFDVGDAANKSITPKPSREETKKKAAVRARKAK